MIGTTQGINDKLTRGNDDEPCSGDMFSQIVGENKYKQVCVIDLVVSELMFSYFRHNKVELLKKNEQLENKIQQWKNKFTTLISKLSNVTS